MRDNQINSENPDEILKEAAQELEKDKANLKADTGERKIQPEKKIKKTKPLSVTKVMSKKETESILKKAAKKVSKKDRKNFIYFFSRIFPSLMILMLFFMPGGMESLDLQNPDSSAVHFNFFMLPFIKNKAIASLPFHFLYYGIFILPGTAFYLLMSIFTGFKEKNSGESTKELSYILVLICLTVYLACINSVILIFANCTRWFLNLPWYIYFCYIFAFVSHCAMSIAGIIFLRNRKPEYAEYKRLLSESELKTKTSLKTKLTFTIISSITIILVLLVYLILSSSRRMFTVSMSDIGRGKAEQTSTAYNAAEGLYLKIQPYFDQQADANKYSDTPFDRIDIIITEKKDNPSIYLTYKDGLLSIKDEDKIVYPSYESLAYSTIPKAKHLEKDCIVTSSQTQEYLKRYISGAYKKSPVYDKETDSLKYIVPVTFSRKEGEKVLGFSIVTYRREVLMQSFFKTEITVFALSIAFLYLAIIISLFISDYIADPLLYLRSNVKKTSMTLAKLMEKNSKLTAEDVKFEDTIKTKDEIKDLSIEIGDMVSLIRGIVPYISFSTLKNAEQDNIIKSTTRDLCFLFTDIRGFTSICEGKPAKDVVDMLNHYLDLETEIILKNGGDVDKFVGDEMMAFFAGPKKEINACKAAMELRTTMRKEQEKALKENLDYINIGIGINTGKVTFGSVGSKQRMDFTSIGDAVNLAARLEGANKIYHSKTIISEAVFSKLKDSFVCREIDYITVKGKTEPVRIYEILQQEIAANDKLYEIKELFEKGLKAYRKQNWDQAAHFFEDCDQKYDDNVAKVFLMRIEHFKKNPPPEKWDGVFRLNVK